MPFCWSLQLLAVDGNRCCSVTTQRKGQFWSSVRLLVPSSHCLIVGPSHRFFVPLSSRSPLRRPLVFRPLSLGLPSVRFVVPSPPRRLDLSAAAPRVGLVASRRPFVFVLSQVVVAGSRCPFIFYCLVPSFSPSRSVGLVLLSSHPGPVVSPLCLPSSPFCVVLSELSSRPLVRLFARPSSYRCSVFVHSSRVLSFLFCLSSLRSGVVAFSPPLPLVPRSRFFDLSSSRLFCFVDVLSRILVP